MADQKEPAPRFQSPDAYFEEIQSRKKLPRSIQEALTLAFNQIPASSFPQVPGGKVIEIPADTPAVDAVRILSEANILSAPVRDPEAGKDADWRERYLGIIDYSAIILWVLENAEIAAFVLSAGSATAAGIGAGALGALGAAALGTTGPVAVAGIAAAAVGAALAGGAVAERGAGKDASTAADHLGEDFYRILRQEEPFKSTMVKSIIDSYRWAPFIPVTVDSSMLSVLLLLSKYRLRNVPIVEPGEPEIKNFITQSAVVHGLEQCKGRDWFDCISLYSLSDLGLPFKSYNEVICVKSEELILEAFKRMKDNRIGGLPVVEGPSRKFAGSVSIRDIRYLLLKPGIFSSFRHLTVVDFMKAITSTDSTVAKESTEQSIICPPDACLGTVIDSLASRSAHRAYVVDNDQEVVGVVTLRDVISCFIDEPPRHFDNYLAGALEMLEGVKKTASRG